MEYCGNETMEPSNRKNEKIFELQTRKNIYEIVTKNAGCHFREIERRTKIPYGTLKYHLNFLVKHSLLIEKIDNNKVRYFPKEIKSEDLEILSLLRQENIRNIILFLLSQEECAHKEISDFVGLSPGTISWHLNKLIKKRIVGKRDSNKTAYYLLYPREEIMRLIISFRESFFDSLIDKVIEMWDLK